MKRFEVDLLVIGSGPAGQRAAIQGAKLGKKVLVVEDGEHIGGGALNAGTFPSKAMRHAVVTLTRWHERKFDSCWTPEASFVEIKERIGCILDERRSVIKNQFDRNGVIFTHGVARFRDPYSIEIVRDGNVIAEVKFRFVVLATGSVPRNPMDVPFDGERLLDSTALLDIKKLPKKMIVLGAGIVGTEYASIFNLLGVSVLLLDKRDVLLGLIDREIREVFQSELSKLGLEFLGNKSPDRIIRNVDSVSVTCTDGSSYSAEVLLYALGRVANTKHLRLDCTGVEMNSRGFINVNSKFQTSIPHIYAAGDVIGHPSLAATSFEQGRLAVRYIFGEETADFPEIFPVGIYTIPEISFVGESEFSLQEKDISFVVGYAHFCELARGVIEANTCGLLKMFVCRNSRRILGVHIVGRRATDLIHIGQMAIHFSAQVDFFADRVFNYPTYSEAYIIAAINASSKL
ncbi:Si-specific NAD(P)(+) transhydrogenase [Candidatus Similichlamydia epinepheli]|uniref:Si-specific NAD(P)(+) transhydrogenase n=1 Tax=Candidatus Similichlamydia epinepheli TaxID=1903953 RepID=UPI000D33D38F|nr:Si-specific NAD(P)(+) transhydrogenase [Candidatus Similichlamydia epinepheli]